MNGFRSHRCVNTKSQTIVFRVHLHKELCNPQQVELNPISKQEKTAYRIGRLFFCSNNRGQANKAKLYAYILTLYYTDDYTQQLN